jgi:hypothetical protein
MRRCGLTAAIAVSPSKVAKLTLRQAHASTSSRFDKLSVTDRQTDRQTDRIVSLSRSKGDKLTVHFEKGAIAVQERAFRGAKEREPHG